VSEGRASGRGRSPHAGNANWRSHKACRALDPDLFFPIGDAGPDLRQIEQAKQICRTCPVCAPCRQWALRLRHVADVWGNTTEQERRAPGRRLAPA
jgi:WhiB family transcriptional regulator, redox-sensing transcriptional regulator